MCEVICMTHHAQRLPSLGSVPLLWSVLSFNTPLKLGILQCRYYAPEPGQHPCMRRVKLTEVNTHLVLNETYSVNGKTVLQTQLQTD